MSAEKPTSFLIRNIRKYQRYKDRKPLWFAVYSSMREDIDYNAVMSGQPPTTDAEFGQIISILALAVRHDDPQKFPDGPSFPFDSKWVQREARMESEPNLSRLVSLCVISCNKMLQPDTVALQDVTPYVSVSDSDKTGKKEPQNSGRKNNIYREQAQEVLSHLVKVSGKGYTNAKNIEACLKREKCSVEDCKAVIDFKWGEWGGGEMEKNVNPTTLWRPSHFQNYLDEARAEKKSRDLFSERPVVIREDFHDWRQRLQDAFSERGADGARDIIATAPESFTSGLRASLTSLMNGVR